MELTSKREADLVNCLCVFGGGVIRLFVSPRIGRVGFGMCRLHSFDRSFEIRPSVYSEASG